jgi:adhesin HecA-like repeat protein
MACNFTQGWPLDCRDTAGGISTIYIAPFSAKGNLQIASGSVTNSGSFLISGSAQNFFTINLHKETAEVTDTITLSDTNNSVYYEQTVSFPLFRGEPKKTNEIKLYAAQSAMIIIKDYSGVSGSYILYGSDAGLDLSGDFKTGKVRGDANGWALSFKGKEMYPGVYVPSASMAALLLPA